MPRNTKKENEWQQATYRRFEFRIRKDSDELKKLESILEKKSFADFVKGAIKKEATEK